MVVSRVAREQDQASASTMNAIDRDAHPNSSAPPSMRSTVNRLFQQSTHKKTVFSKIVLLRMLS